MRKLRRCEINRQSIAIGNYWLFGFVLAILASSLGRSASAGERSWIGGNSNWSAAINWDPFGAPAAGDDVFIKNIDGVSRTIFYDYNGFFFPPTLNSLNIGLTGGTPVDTATLSMTNGASLKSNNEFVGSLGLGNASGTINQSAGGNTISVAGGLYPGTYATDQGFYH